MNLNQSELKSFFYGTLLGDSYIIKGSFQCKQISKDLIDFKAKIIKQYIPNCHVSVTEHAGYVDKNGVNHQRYYQLRTNKHEYFKKMQEIFYDENNVKIYQEGIISKLTPIGFAVWYADDGTTILIGKNNNGSSNSRRVQICTDNFTKEEHIIIKKELEEKFDYTIKIVDRGRRGQVRIQMNDMKKNQKFLEKIEPYFFKYFPSLLYKIDLGYRNIALEKRHYVLEDYHNLYIKISAHPSFIDRVEGR